MNNDAPASRRASDMMIGFVDGFYMGRIQRAGEQGRMHDVAAYERLRHASIRALRTVAAAHHCPLEITRGRS